MQPFQSENANGSESVQWSLAPNYWKVGRGPEMATYYPTSSLSRQQVVAHCQYSCIYWSSFTDERGGGGGVKSHDSESACFANKPPSPLHLQISVSKNDF